MVRVTKRTVTLQLDSARLGCITSCCLLSINPSDSDDELKTVREKNREYESSQEKLSSEKVRHLFQSYYCVVIFCVNVCCRFTNVVLTN